MERIFRLIFHLIIKSIYDLFFKKKNTKLRIIWCWEDEYKIMNATCSMNFNFGGCYNEENILI